MTKLVDEAAHEVRKAEHALSRWKARAGSRPSENMKEERRELRAQLREQEVLLIEYERIREAKIPFQDKLPKDTVFYSFFMNLMDKQKVNQNEVH
jgi:hypothetical protein